MHVMAALKKWHSKFGLRNRFEVLIGGIRYSVRGATSNQKNLRKPGNSDMWSVISWTGHLAKLVHSEEEKYQCALSKEHRDAIMHHLYLRVLPNHSPWNTGNENRTRRHLMSFQLEFFHYCIHDSVLTIFLGIIMALTIEALR